MIRSLGKKKQSSTTSRKIFILLAICCVAVATPFSFTGIAVGLPAISNTLGGSPIQLNWAINSFLLTFGSTLMAAGTLADNYGRKRVLLIGSIIYGMFSVCLAFFTINLVWFDLLRAFQGIGAAAAFAGGFASLSQEFEGQQRLRAFSIVGTSFGIGLAFGPIVAGWLIATFGWQAIFVLTATLAVIAFFLAMVFMTESRDPEASGLDWKGAISFTLALSLFTFGIIQGPESGWNHPFVVTLLIAAVVLFVAFVMIERSSERPMLDLSLFRFPRFLGAQLLAVAPSFAFVVLLVLLPIRFVGIEEMDEIAVGKIMMALSAPFLILPIASGYMTRWFTPGIICSIGFAISAIGLYWLGHFTDGSEIDTLIGSLLTIGVGISLPWGLMDGLAVSVVPKERAGMATGIFSTSRVAGEGLVIAVVTAIFSALTSGNIEKVAGKNASLVAQRLVTGDIKEALVLVPSVEKADLHQVYSKGFSTLMFLLCGITVLTALFVFIFLRKEVDTVEE
ncbi:MFS transporter [Olivibacter domesticus]|uniref:Sugar phosphate permease n=1 Tax=Olivibacter domesticus TaxID=407022 RepID=A0A1H7KNW3_OLID1|nr:MFS transporter [Olivibacter domesticus]SEK88206.1 Sugar phosphate permease [Olivibacter domesticus]